MQEEIWVCIYNNMYSVSNFGRVKSNSRYVNTKAGIRYFKGKILKPEVVADGHLRVVLCEACVKKRVFVHRLVAESFIPNPNNFPIINHKDENPANNHVDNLEWCTFSYNNRYNGKNERTGDAEGHDVAIYDSDWNFIEILPSIAKTARKYGYSSTTMWRAIKGKKLLNGYYFKEL